jgi:hypothetical protein
MGNKIILLVAGFIPFLLRAQVSINAQLPAAGVVQKESLWNLVVINNQNDMIDCNIKMTLQDNATGQVVLTAVSGNFILGKGVKVIANRTLQPVQYNYAIQDFSRNYLPLGTYTACYRLNKNGVKGDEPLAEECVRINIDPLSPPLLHQLINPKLLPHIHNLLGCRLRHLICLVT